MVSECFALGMRHIAKFSTQPFFPVLEVCRAWYPFSTHGLRGSSCSINHASPFEMSCISEQTGLWERARAELAVRQFLRDDTRAVCQGGAHLDPWKEVLACRNVQGSCFSISVADIAGIWGKNKEKNSVIRTSIPFLRKIKSYTNTANRKRTRAFLWDMTHIPRTKVRPAILLQHN